MNVECTGDLCDFGPSGHLEAVPGSTRWAVLHWESGQMDAMGKLKPLKVDAASVHAYADVDEGEGGGLTGCEWKVAIQDPKERDGALMATRGRSCGGTDPGCPAICKQQGYPTELTLQPITLGQ